MTGDLLYEMFVKAGVVLEGHFLLTSGRHSNIYINKDAIYSQPSLFYQVVSLMSNELQPVDYDVITGPAIAGAVLAAPISLEVGGVFVYPEKAVVSQTDETVGFALNAKGLPKGIMVFRRGYDKLIPDKKVVIIEDVITTGGSVQQTIDAVHNLGGEVVEVFAIWNRTGWKPSCCYVTSLVDKAVESWLEAECPLCEAGDPLTDPKTI